ncbi:hypothetical protein C8R43DRAFT_1242315 [Mycena crocata]|nr:hypothetical protein C8R43DRAFT_1242315 [Mycena crocata]
MEKAKEDWEPTGVTSKFAIILQDGISTMDNQQAKVGAGIQYTGLCGFGWRFAIRIDGQEASATSPKILDEDGNPIKSFLVSLFFDPHFIRAAAFNAMITVTTQVQHLIPNVLNAPPAEYRLPFPSSGPAPLGTYVYPISAAAPTVSFSVLFPPSLGLALPRPMDTRLGNVLEESLAGKELVDIKFYAFSRYTSGSATQPLALFASTSLLKGFSDDLDTLVSGRGFAEANIVNLDMHTPKDTQFDDYGYDSDSDLECDEEEQPESSTIMMPLRPSSPSTAELKSKIDTEQYLRRGRVIVLKDTAYKTWKALLYYIYTHQVKFLSLHWEGATESESDGLACSAKSMYRLADKLGLEELKSSALSHIASRLSEENILLEVFSSFTSMYPAVQTMEIDYLTSHFSEKASEGLKQMTKRICDGEKSYCAETLFLIIQKMGSKT